MVFSLFFVLCVFAQGFSLKMQLVEQNTWFLIRFITFLESKTLKTLILDRFVSENTIKATAFQQFGAKTEQTLTIDTYNRESQQTLTIDTYNGHSRPSQQTLTIDTYNRHTQETLPIDTSNRHVQQTLTIDTYNRHLQQTLTIDTHIGNLQQTLTIDTYNRHLQQRLTINTVHIRGLSKMVEKVRLHQNLYTRTLTLQP